MVLSPELYIWAGYREKLSWPPLPLAGRSGRRNEEDGHVVVIGIGHRFPPVLSLCTPYTRDFGGELLSPFIHASRVEDGVCLMDPLLRLVN